MAEQPDARATGFFSRFSSRVVDDETERVFRDETHPTWVARIRLVALLCAVFYAAGGLLDWLSLGWGSGLWPLLAVRLLVAAALVGASMAATRSRDYQQWLDLLVLVVLGVVIVGTLMVIVLSPGSHITHSVTVLAILLVVYLLVPLRIHHLVIAGSLMSVLFLVVCVTHFDLTLHESALVAFHLVLVNSLGGVVGWNLECSRRREFFQLQRERDAHQRLQTEADARVHVERALAESEARYRSLVELSPYAIVVHRHGEVLYVNPTGVRLMGGEDLEELVGHSVVEYLLPEFREKSVARLRWLEQNGDRLEEEGVQLPPIEARVRRLDGRVVPCEVRSGRTVFGGEVAVQSVISDVTDRKKLEAELRRMATTDPLTGAVNRRRFLELVAVEWSRSRRHGRPLSVLMVDIDRFKSVNDEKGHAVGDAVLVGLVETCVKILRAEAIVGRMGGDEFAILLPEVGLEGALVVSERLRDAVASRVFESDGDPVSATVSIGVAAGDIAGEHPEACLKRADDALLTAKRQGRNSVRAG